jgi:cytochrome c
MQCLAITPDSGTLVTATSHALQMWDPAGRRTRPPLPTGSPAVALAVAPDGSRLAAALESGTIRQWTMQGGNLPDIDEFEHRPTHLAFSPTGSFLAAACEAALQVWDVPAERHMATLHLGRSLEGCAWAPDGTRLYAVGPAGLYGFVPHTSQ